MPEHLDKFKKTINDIKKTCEDVFEELGPGFEESDYQMAMSLEFAKSKEFEAIREISVELFYKDQYLKFGELDFLISPKENSKDYPLPFFIETKVVNNESADPYDQIRRYLMSLPKNSSSIINQIEIAALIVFGKNSKIEKGEVLKKEGNEILKREPSFLKMPSTKVYVNCYYYDKSEKVIKLIDGLL
jgi:GxxExxY protein